MQAMHNVFFFFTEKAPGRDEQRVLVFPRSKAVDGYPRQWRVCDLPHSGGLGAADELL